MNVCLAVMCQNDIDSPHFISLQVDKGIRIESVREVQQIKYEGGQWVLNVQPADIEASGVFTSPPGSVLAKPTPLFVNRTKRVTSSTGQTSQVQVAKKSRGSRKVTEAGAVRKTQPKQEPKITITLEGSDLKKLKKFKDIIMEPESSKDDGNVSSDGYLLINPPDLGVGRSDPGVVTSYSQSLYAHDYWQARANSDSDNELDNRSAGSKDERKRKRSTTSKEKPDLTDKQRFELAQFAAHNSHGAKMAEMFSEKYGFPVNKSLILREYLKYKLLTDMYKHEPTLSLFLKHRKDSMESLSDEQKTEVVEY